MTVLYADAKTVVWRGKDYHDLAPLRVGDEVDIRYREAPGARLVMIDIAANIDKVEGRITKLAPGALQVDNYYNADPDSGYPRGLRDIVLESDTEFVQGRRSDLKAGCDVMVIGLKLETGILQASRVWVYGCKQPVGRRSAAEEFRRPASRLKGGCSQDWLPHFVAAGEETDG